MKKILTVVILLLSLTGLAQYPFEGIVGLKYLSTDTVAVYKLQIKNEIVSETTQMTVIDTILVTEDYLKFYVDSVFNEIGVTSIDEFFTRNDSLLIKLSGEELTHGVDLSQFMDNTDNQQIYIDSTDTQYFIWIDEGDTIYFPKAALAPVDSIYTEDLAGFPVEKLMYDRGASTHEVTKFLKPYGIAWGGYVSHVTGLTLNITPTFYYINGDDYTSNSSNVTLSTADATYARIDVIAVDTTGSVVVIEGTPSNDPVKPVIDPLYQVELTQVLIMAGATTPDGITNNLIYDENVEWTGSSSGVTVNFNGATSPYSGSKVTDVSTLTNLDKVIYQNGSNINVDEYMVISFAVKLKQALTRRSSLKLAFIDSPTKVSNEYTITLNNTSTDWQVITIPLSVITWTKTYFNGVVFQYSSTTSHTGLYIDRVFLQKGITQQEPTGDSQNLTYTPYPDKGIMNISGGTSDTIPIVNEVNAGLMTPEDKAKLDSVSVHPPVTIATESADIASIDENQVLTINIPDVTNATNLFYTGVVTDRNIDVTLEGYTPFDRDMKLILPDDSISEGDTITISFNGGSQYPVYGHTVCEDSLALWVVFKDSTWFVLGNLGDDFTVENTNTGDQHLIFNNDTLSLSGDTTKVFIGGGGEQVIDTFSISGNNIRISISGDGEAFKSVDVSTTTAVAANTAKVTNATHTGEVTGATSLTIADNVVDYGNVAVTLKDTIVDNDLSWDYSAHSIVYSTITGGGTIALTNGQINKTVLVVLTVSSFTAITVPANITVLSGSATFGNGVFYLYLHCIGTNSYLMSIIQEQ